MKSVLRILWSTTAQVGALIALSQMLARIPWIGRPLSILVDNVLLYAFGIEVCSRTLAIDRLIVGHSTGVVLGGNGIRCTGTLHISSGVVFARRFVPAGSEPEFFFDIEGDLIVGANSVLLGPLRIAGPVTIGALSLVTHDITQPGVYVGQPARLLHSGSASTAK